MNEARLRGRLSRDAPLARWTTWRVGGPADLLYEPADADDLATFLTELPVSLPVHWLGLGSNVLILDGGVRGAVIRTQRALAGLAPVGDADIEAGAGVPCAKLARWCARRGLAGGEYLAGIPGTLGGALAMNAGAWGGETWRSVVHVDTVERGGRRHRRSPGDYAIGYRSVRGPSTEWFLGARLRFEPGADPAALAERVRGLLAQRAETQPTGRPSCGSVFRNPPGDHAARLIEKAGLKAAREGGAYVSAKHANFIINDGSATAADIAALLERVRTTVAAGTGICLEPEVRVIGEEACHA